MIETREKLISGATYTATQLPARRAIRLKAKLIKLFGPVLAQVFMAIQKDDESSQKNGLVQAVEILSNHIEENSFENLIMELLVGVRKNGMELTPAIIDMEFAGDMESLYHVVWFVIEVNYANFFTLMGIGKQFSHDPKQTADTKKTFMRK